MLINISGIEINPALYRIDPKHYCHQLQVPVGWSQSPRELASDTQGATLSNLPVLIRDTRRGGMGRVAESQMEGGGGNASWLKL